MWKRLDRAISYSKKVSDLKDVTFRVWVHLLPWTDCEGRFSADPIVIKAQCLVRYAYRLDQVQAALDELELVGLLHLYNHGSERFLVLHDHAEYNPPGRLRNQKAEWPGPASVKCKCVEARRADGVPHGDCPSVPSRLVSSVGGSGGCERCRGLGLVPVLLKHDRHGDTQIMFPCPVCKPDAFELATPMFDQEGWKMPPREADRRKPVDTGGRSS